MYPQTADCSKDSLPQFFLFKDLYDITERRYPPIVILGPPPPTYCVWIQKKANVEV